MNEYLRKPALIVTTLFAVSGLVGVASAQQICSITAMISSPSPGETFVTSAPGGTAAVTVTWITTSGGDDIHAVVVAKRGEEIVFESDEQCGGSVICRELGGSETLNLEAGTYAISLTATCIGTDQTASDDLEFFVNDPVIPAVAIDELIAAVEACVANGELKASHGQALTNKLESALKKLDKDDTVAVVEKLQGFIDQVTSLEAEGQISADKANALIADAQAILNAVQGPGKSSPTALRPTAQKTTWSTTKSIYR